MPAVGRGRVLGVGGGRGACRSGRREWLQVVAARKAGGIGQREQLSGEFLDDGAALAGGPGRCQRWNRSSQQRSRQLVGGGWPNPCRATECCWAGNAAERLADRRWLGVLVATVSSGAASSSAVSSASASARSGSRGIGLREYRAPSVSGSAVSGSRGIGLLAVSGLYAKHNGVLVSGPGGRGGGAGRGCRRVGGRARRGWGARRARRAGPRR